MADSTLALQLEEIRRRRGAQLAQILQGGGGQAPAPLSSMTAAPPRQHSDPKQNLGNLVGTYQMASPYIGTLSSPLAYGVGAGGAAPAIASITAAPGAATAAGSGIMAAGAPVAGAQAGTGALGAIGTALGAAGTAIGGAATAAGGGIASLIGMLGALI